MDKTFFVFTKFMPEIYSGQTLRGCPFPSYIDLKDADFSGATLRGVNFKGLDLSRATFKDANIQGANFTDAILCNADFTNVKAGLQKRSIALHLIILLLPLVIFSVTAITMGYVLGGTSVIAMFLAVIYDLSSSAFGNVTPFAPLAIILIVVVIVLTTIAYQDFTITAFTIIGASMATLVTGVSVIAIILAGLGVNQYANYANEASINETEAATGIILILSLAFPLILGAMYLMGVTAAVAVAYVFVAASFATAAVALNIPPRVLNLFTLIALLVPNWLDIPSLSFIIVPVSLLSSHIVSHLLQNTGKFVVIKNFATAFASIGGTTFYKADLTGATFTGSTLKNTDLRDAVLTQVCWRNSQNLDFSRLSNCYLKNPQIQQLVTTLDGQNQNFNRYDLRGVNLEGANLQNVSFVDADLTQVNLQGANLSGAILVHTRLERANLTGVTLTGACIDNWFVSQSTILKNIDCKYVFMKYDFNRLDKRDQIPLGREFEPGEFIRYVRAIIDTVDLYHDGDINPRAALVVLRGISAKYQEPLEIVGLQRRDQAVVLVVKVSEWTDREQFQDEYNTEYERLLSLYLQPNEDLRYLLSDPQLAELTSLVEDIQQRPTNYIEYFYNKGGSVMIGNSGNMNVDQSRTVHVEGNVVGSVLNLGELSGNVTSTINQLPDQPSSTDQPSLKDLLSQLQEAIEEEAELSSEDKADLLEQVKALAEAKQTSDTTQKEGLVRKAMKITEATLRSLPDTASIVEACSKLLPMILKALGVSI